MTVELFHGKSWEIINGWEPGQYQFDCLLADPPYGMDFQSTYGKDAADREKFQAKIEDDGTPEAAIKGFHRTFRAALPFLNPDQCEMYVFSHWHVCGEWQDYLSALDDKYGFKLKQLIIWEKGWPGIGDVVTNWGAGHEFIYYLKRGARKMPYRRSGVLHVDKVLPGTNIHPTEKPTKLLKMLIEMSTDPGQWVLDPYAGSGSTLEACRETNRNAIGIEKKDSYVQDATTRLSSGSLFDV